MLDLSVAEKLYNLRINDFLPLSSGGGIYKISTDRGNFVLKPKRFGDDEFRFIATACHYLAENDVAVADVVATADGRLWFEFADKNADESANREYFLMNYAEGRVADFTDAQQLRAVAEALAKLHDQSRGFYCSCFADRNKIGKFADYVNVKINDMKKWQRRLEQKEQLCYFDFLYLSHAESEIERSLAVAESLNGYYDPLAAEYESRGGICHHDLAHHNILLKPDGKGYQVAFVDFDYTIADIFVHDLASILLRIAKANGYNGEQPLIFLREYEKTMAIGERERRLLWDYLRFPQVFWQLGLSFYEEVPCLDDSNKKRTRRGRLDKRLTEYINSEVERGQFLEIMRGAVLCG